MCLGTIGMSSASIVDCGCFKVMTSWFPVAVTLEKLATKLPFAVAASVFVIIRL